MTLATKLTHYAMGLLVGCGIGGGLFVAALLVR